jgi:hypothetical protein
VKRYIIVSVLLLLAGLSLTSCDLLSGSDPGLESTRVALAVQQTSLAMEQTNIAQNQNQPADPNAGQAVQPTYTSYPTYTSQPVQETVVEETEIPPEEEVVSFEDWLDDVEILLYDEMYGLGQSVIIENAVDGLGLGSNTKNVGGAMGDFLSELNSATVWDLIIVAAEDRDAISGEYFDVLANQIDRGSSIIIEIWYIDDIAQGRIQPVMQRCGIAFHRDWWRDWNSDLNEYLVYLLEPSDPMFSQPNTMSMLIPSTSYMWLGDVGDMMEINSGSDAVLLAGTQANTYDAYGSIAECLDGRMVWQTFSTHDYKYQDMINLWQNYVYNTLLARYDYLMD